MVVQVKHPVYSLDLSHCYFSLPHIEKMLGGHNYSCETALTSAIFQSPKTIQRADHPAAFKSWISCLQKCIQVKEEYSEGQTNSKPLKGPHHNYSTSIKTF